MDYTKPKRQRLTHHAPPSPPQTPLPLFCPSQPNSHPSNPGKPPAPAPAPAPPPANSRCVPPKPPALYPPQPPPPPLSSLPLANPNPTPSPPRAEVEAKVKAKTHLKTNVGTSTSSSPSPPPNHHTPFRAKQATNRETFNQVLRAHQEARERLVLSQETWRLEEDLMREALKEQIEGLRREVERGGMATGMDGGVDEQDEQEETDEEQAHERYLHREEFQSPSQTGERLSLDFEYAGSESESDSECESECERTSSHQQNKADQQAPSTKSPDITTKTSAPNPTTPKTTPLHKEGPSTLHNQEKIIEPSIPTPKPQATDSPTVDPDSETECPTQTMIDVLFPSTPSTPRTPPK
ncbi:hypothetical protein EYC80_001567 [Monilinia laxa]|uniref:Uncharacterized protein n=1 Tax=Monilinia laxa TaxID=61186 RepID=A0A5N6K5F1_MONLA|nr:hypothetical protein EYC80_001567 [Monilinia laxa]